MKGSIILIEGRDGSGKSTQVEKLKAHFEAQGIPTHYQHFPNYDSPTGQVILEMLKGDTKLMEYSPETGLLEPHPEQAAMLQALFAVNRYEIATELEILAEDGIVLLDRYTESSFAYGEATYVSKDWLVHINGRLPKPDMAIYLDVDLEESLKRRPERRDLFESDRELQERLDEHYKLEWKLRHLAGRHYYVVDGHGSPDDVFEAILSCWEKARPGDA